MLYMQWVVAGLLFALFQAFTMLVNQKYRIDGHLISGLRGVGVAICFWPAVLFVKFPNSWSFWGLILLQGRFLPFLTRVCMGPLRVMGRGLHRASVFCLFQ